MKQKSILRYQIALCCFVVVLAALTLVIKSSLAGVLTPLWPFQLLFLLCISLITNHLTQKKMQGDVTKFANFYMIMTVSKLLLYLSILLVYALVFPSYAKSFIMTFLAYYVCFMIFNVITSVKMKKYGQ